jgi:hypothetical protein
MIGVSCSLPARSADPGRILTPRLGREIGGHLLYYMAGSLLSSLLHLLSLYAKDPPQEVYLIYKKPI